MRRQALLNVRTRLTLSDVRALWRAGLDFASGDGRGIAGSLALHGLFALLVLLIVLHRAGPPIAPTRFVPVDIVHIGEETTSPPTPVKAKIPKPFASQTAIREPASANRPEGTSPVGAKPLPDMLESRLDALAHLRQPQSNARPVETAAAEEAVSSDAPPGTVAAYAVRDLIRAQVMRKWAFDVAALGNHSFQIALRVVVLRNGTVAKAEILDRERYTRDALYRDIALSARNAVLLSSPLTLPDGVFGDRIEVTLSLNPRDALK
jgi:hypothetical protein